MVAKLIIQLAQDGERDPTRLAKRAINEASPYSNAVGCDPQTEGIT
jgi:hypothetical protein